MDASDAKEESDAEPSEAEAATHLARDRAGRRRAHRD
jgi:hypothetical protein